MRWLLPLCLKTAPLHSATSQRAHAPLMLAARGRDAGIVADATNIVRIGRSRTLEERNHWSRQDAWSPRDRSDVVLPIDDDALYESLRSLSNRTTSARPLSKRKVGVTTIRWLSRKTETCAQEYLDYYDGVTSAQRFLERRRAAAAAAATSPAASASASPATAAADDDVPSVKDAVRAAVSERFSPIALQRRVDEAPGPTPALPELEHAPLARRHLPTSAPPPPTNQHYLDATAPLLCPRTARASLCLACCR